MTVFKIPASLSVSIMESNLRKEEKTMTGNTNRMSSIEIYNKYYPEHPLPNPEDVVKESPISELPKFDPYVRGHRIFITRRPRCLLERQ